MVRAGTNAKEHRQQIQQPVDGIEQSVERVRQGEPFDCTKAEDATLEVIDSNGDVSLSVRRAVSLTIKPRDALVVSLCLRAHGARFYSVAFLDVVDVPGWNRD